MRLLLLLLGVWGYSQVAPPQPTLRSTTIYPTTFIVETNDFITVVNTRPQPILKPILPIQQNPKTNREFWTPRTYVAPWKPKTIKECKE